jgi:hypothetical protein
MPQFPQLLAAVPMQRWPAQFGSHMQLPPQI